MLAACHGRIRGFCATLVRLEAHVAALGSDAAASRAARDVIRYFDRAGRAHHADEEEDLFPALIESMAGSDPVCIRELVGSLASEHRELERLWIPVRVWLAAIEARAAVLPDGHGVEAFVALQERHAAREEAELFPMAERLLGPAELDGIGRSMSARRAVGRT